MINRSQQKEKALLFHNLHKTGNLLILPNIWDILGAKLLEKLGFPAIATASASIAFANGYDDGENIKFSHLLQILHNIALSVDAPVSADIESGYAYDDDAFQENVKMLVDTGIIGINIEDTNHAAHSLIDVYEQCRRIKMIRGIAEKMDVPLFINARTDILLYDQEFPSPKARINAVIDRGLAYKDAGANCFYPIALRNKEDIEILIKEIDMPINILTIAGAPELNILQDIGVARVSLGPSFLKIAVQAMKDLACNLKELRGLTTIAENEITTNFLKSLIND